MAKRSLGSNGHAVEAPIHPPILNVPASRKFATPLRPLLADVFALYVKTKNFHWHMSGPHFRDYHLLLDEHGDQIFSMTDDIAERPQDRRHDAALDRRNRQAPEH